MSIQHMDRRSFLDSGAIFMANQLTREECFEKKLFGLPANYTDFVTRIKIGMLLFLFDFSTRKLYGVFEASSDGGSNLVPDAYKSSKLKFPAQVRFNILWQCAPLQEDAFKDAIRENYFTQYKFNFGLSREQVCRLLGLFEKTKLSIQCSHMSEGYYQRPSKIVTDESHPLSTRELMTKSMPIKLASVVVCDPKLDLDEPIDDSTAYQVYEHQDEEENHMSRLYSNNRQGRLSVFKRLSGWSKVIEQKSDRVNARPYFEGISDSPQRLDTKHTVSHSHGEKASINTSVISGLGNNVKMGAKNEQPENLSGTNVEICKDSKRKATFSADKQQKRKCLLKTTGPSLTEPLICASDEESVDDKLDHSIQLRNSCDQDPVEMLLAQYKDYLSRSRMEDQSAHTCVT